MEDKISHYDLQCLQLCVKSANSLSIDVGCAFLTSFMAMIAKSFGIWNYAPLVDVEAPLLLEINADYQKELSFKTRVAMVAVDKISGRSLSKGLAGIVGILLNRSLKAIFMRVLDLYCANETADARLAALASIDTTAAELDFCEQEFLLSVRDSNIDTTLAKYWNPKRQ